MGKSTISMAIFNSKLLVYQGVYPIKSHLNPIKPPFFLWFFYVHQWEPPITSGYFLQLQTRRLRRRLAIGRHGSTLLQGSEVMHDLAEKPRCQGDSQSLYGKGVLMVP